MPMESVESTPGLLRLVQERRKVSNRTKSKAKVVLQFITNEVKENNPLYLANTVSPELPHLFLSASNSAIYPFNSLPSTGFPDMVTGLMNVIFSAPRAATKDTSPHARNPGRWTAMLK